jgi:Glycosyltransferase like family 2
LGSISERSCSNGTPGPNSSARGARPQREQTLGIGAPHDNRPARHAENSEAEECVDQLPVFSYVLPLRWRDDLGGKELADYLARLAGVCDEIIVIDGSPESVFAANERAFGHLVLHVAADQQAPGKMRKVPAVMAGVRLASHEAIVIADDDVRYEPVTLIRAVRLLCRADLVRPQNYFEPLPWHARWDTARTLLNRAIGADFPGTLAIRRSKLLAVGGYDPDVVFENLELIRTIRASGGQVRSPLDLYVRRLPPSTSHFIKQRTRQAYEDFAIPARMTCWLAILPWLVVFPQGRRKTLLALAGGAIALAERGRRRRDGRRVFPFTSSLLAPAWLLERSVCAWLAVLARLRFGGIRYHENVIFTAANSTRTLRKRMRGS